MMLGFKKDKKDDDNGPGGNPFIGLEKTSVLQETRTFNETPLSNRKCIQVLAKIIFMINQGEQLGPTEAREAFFATTRLFQSKDVTLRRMVHLVIKELPTAPDDAIIATSSLTKDMTGKEDGYRATAIRALCKITDITMLTSIERYLKQAIVDRNPAVSSAALVSTLHLGKDGPTEMVKRWTNEINEALNSDNIMVQYHALGLLYSVKKQDRLAVSKLLAKYTRGGIKSPYACCFLIRICCKVIEENENDNNSSLIEFLEACLRHKSEIVIYEAARALVSLPNITGREIAPAISVLQLFLSSPKPTLRFAAVKTLNKVAIAHPSSVTMCNLDLEHLISDSNRSIATLAITTLLKTGSEGSIERLMRQIQSFMTEIPDEFKIIVIEAIQSLCLKFPKKHMIMMNLLATMLREEGGYDYKAAIVNTLIAIIEQNPGSQDTGLYHLCEFIEDCEHGVLATKILHLLGREGPKTSIPSKFIRYIYNRVILENPTVRAAAVTSLAKFGALCLDLQPSILVLLRRCLYDSHDEVRDRATFYLAVLESGNTALANHYIIDTLNSSIVGLQSLLVHYIEGRGLEEPFNLNSVPITTAPAQVTTPSSKIEDSSDRKSAAPKKTRQEEFAEKLSEIPQFASLGPLFKSCAKPVELSESETEYYVQCNVHTFQRHLVLQFDLLNTLNDQLLEQVKVDVEGEEYTVLGHIPCPSLPYNTPGTCYTLLELPLDHTEVASTFACTLKFVVKDCDPNTGEADPEGYEDEYVLEDLDIGLNCLFQRVFKPSFNTSWDDLGAGAQAEQTYTLSTMKSLPSAVDQITAFLGMQPCERSEKVTEGKNSHTLLLAGQFKGGVDCLVRAKLAFDGAVSMNICARSGDPEVSELIVSSIG